MSYSVRKYQFLRDYNRIATNSKYLYKKHKNELAYYLSGAAQSPVSVCYPGKRCCHWRGFGFCNVT